MAKIKNKDAETNDSGDKKIVSSKDLVAKLLKEHKDHHFNFEEAKEYLVSTGSIILDLETGGGLGPGLHRACGITEGGKTSFSLEVLRNFLLMPKTKGVYIKAEGRLGKNIRDRSGLNFVWSPEEWEEGTVLVIETNIYETAVDIMTKLISDNSEGLMYFFLLDSVDGLSKSADNDKGYEDSDQVAGGAVIASRFMKKVSIPMAKRGHMGIFISQIRSDIKIDQKTKTPIRLISGTGGNALMHFSNWIFDFEPPFNGDQICQDGKEDKKNATPDNPVVGHYAKVVFRKTDNEKTGTMVRYPIRHGRVGGRSIWLEKEIVDILMMWGYIERKGSWFNWDAEFYEKHGLGKFNLPEKVQGAHNMLAALEANPDSIPVLKAFCIDLIKNNGVSK